MSEGGIVVEEEGEREGEEGRGGREGGAKWAREDGEFRISNEGSVIKRIA